MTLLSMSGVRFAYPGTPVLEDVSLALEPGERVALLGPNGVGKTTLTKLVVALLHPDAGTVAIQGRRTDRLAPEDLADTVAYLFQHPDQQLFARTLLDEAMFAPLMRGASRERAEAQARLGLRRVGLSPVADHHPYDVSLGEQKLLALGCAIAQNPKLLVLDEPTQGLDRARTALVQEALNEFAESGTALLAVTHDLGFVAEVCRRAVVLCAGRVAYDGHADELIRDAERLRDLALAPPVAAALARRLGLDGHPLRVRDVAEALAARCRA